MNTTSAVRHHAVARALHWTVAGLVPPQLALGFAAERVADRGLSDALLAMHFQLGMLILGLMAVRVLWRVVRGTPTPVHTPGWRAHGARGVHGGMYVLLLAIPVSGYVIWIWMDAARELLGVIEVPSLFSPPRDDESGRAAAWYMHFYGAWSLSALLVGHVMAALHHQFVLRDDLIGRRMR